MDRIEFEEWSLKAIDPALAPRAWDSVNAETDEQGTIIPRHPGSLADFSRAAFKNKGSKPLERVRPLHAPCDSR